MAEGEKPSSQNLKQKFSGNIYIFHAFDVGDDINLEKIEQTQAIKTLPLRLPKYFKKYHIPLAVELPHPHNSTDFKSGRIHSFGAISLTYQIPFTETLTELRKQFNHIFNEYQEQSVIDVKSIFKRISPYITKPKFFDVKSSYVVIQVDPEPNKISVVELQEKYGSVIASTVRFETETLSEEQKNEMLDSAIGYYRGDLIIIDTDAAFVYATEFKEIQNFFEFANIQQLELHYFDKLLDQQLNKIYEEEVRRIPFSMYLPFIGMFTRGPVESLGKLKADISVITERLESSIRLAGEPFFSEIHGLLVDKLNLKNWRSDIDRKLDIIQDIRSIYQHKTDAIREDILSVLIIVLILIELIVALIK